MTGQPLDKAADILGKSPRTILRWIKGGKIPAEKIDGEWRVDVSGAVTTDRTGAADILAAKDKVIEILEAEIATLKAELAATNERLRESHILLQQRQLSEPGKRPWWAFWRHS